MKAKEIFDKLYKINGIQFLVDIDSICELYKISDNKYVLSIIEIDLDSEVSLHQNSITFKGTDGEEYEAEVYKLTKLYMHEVLQQ